MIGESQSESDLARHCMTTHARGLPGAQEPYLSRDFEPAGGVTWNQVHNNLHRLAGKHGELAHFGPDAYDEWELGRADELRVRRPPQ